MGSDKQWVRAKEEGGRDGGSFREGVIHISSLPVVANS